jgi:hypothetical protein
VHDWYAFTLLVGDSIQLAVFLSSFSSILVTLGATITINNGRIAFTVSCEVAEVTRYQGTQTRRYTAMEIATMESKFV